MGLHRWLGAILITSIIGLAGCNKPPEQSGASSTPATTVESSTPAAQETTSPETPSSAATEAATPSESGSPESSGTPATPGAESGASDYENAEGQTGFDEVKGLTPVASSPDSIAKGKELFAANCASCHGATGLGDGEAGKALDPPPRNMHAKAEFKYGSSPLAAFRTAKYGVDGTGMAGFEGVLTDDQIWNVVHYVETLEGT